MIRREHDWNPERLMIELLTRLSLFEESEASEAEEPVASARGVQCADITGFAPYLEEHIERVTSLESHGDWLTFVADGFASEKPDVAHSCRTFHNVLRARDDAVWVGATPNHIEQRVWKNAAAVARVFCSRQPALGPAIYKWTQSEAALASAEPAKSRRLFYVSYPRKTRSGGALVWLTHLDEDHLSARSALDVWARWKAGSDPDRTLVFIPGDDHLSYWVSDSNVLPMVRPQALVSMVALQDKASFVCRALLAPHHSSGGASVLPVEAWPTAPKAPAAPRNADASPQAPVEETHSIRERGPMPLFSTMDMFFGRRSVQQDIDRD